MSECVAHNEREGMKEHKQDRNEDGGGETGRDKKTKKYIKMRLCGDGSSVCRGWGESERARSNSLAENLRACLHSAQQSCSVHGC